MVGYIREQNLGLKEKDEGIRRGGEVVRGDREECRVREEFLSL